MLRATLLGVLLFAACSLEPPPDLVIYNAVPVVLPDGESRTRSLLVTSAGDTLGVRRGPEGVLFRTGTAGSLYEDLRSVLARARHLPKDTAPWELGVRVYTISAVLGGESIQFTRDPTRRVEKDVERATEVLEAIWGETRPVEDVVGATARFLSSDDAMIRGWVVVCLLKVWRDESAGEELHAAVEAALRKHLETEEVRDIVHGIRDVIDQPGDQPEEQPEGE